MAAVLVVIYIPCDNDDEDKNNHNAGGRRGSKSQNSDGEGKEGATTTTAIPKSPSSEDTNIDAVDREPEPETQIENGDIVLAEKKGSEHLPLLEHAAESPVVLGIRTSTPTDGSGTEPRPSSRRRVRIADDVKDDDGESIVINKDDRDSDEVAHPDGSETTASTLDSWSLEDALQSLLGNLNIDNDVWVRTDDETVLQVSFLVPVEEVDAILRSLTAFGLGSIPDTSITTFPSSFHRELQSKKVDVTETDVAADGTITKSKKKLPDDKSDFIKTIKSRLTVAQVVAAVEGNARATFDFIMLICLASFIAALGLVENSSVVLVASMLISPLMGPILGGVFGFVIQNRDLTSLGVKNASIGLLLCLVVGFLFGLAVAGVNCQGAEWGGSAAWPTDEMRSRGMTRSLWVGVLIALPSGAGVALSVLGGNVGSLVGVAISASLLPPAVNAGMLWAHSLISFIAPPETIAVAATLATTTLMTPTTTSNASLINSTVASTMAPVPVTYPIPPHCPALRDNAYQFVYSCTMANDMAILGAVSLFLTILNILCIFIMGVIVLKIKEVAPNTTVSPVTEVFWKKDLPIARDCYKTLKGKDSLDAAKMAKDIAQEWKKKHEDLDPKDMRKSWHFMINDLQHSATIENFAHLQPTIGAPRRHTFMHNLTSQGHELIEDPEDLSSPVSSFYTTHSSYSTLRQRNPFFDGVNAGEHRPTPSPIYITPPTSATTPATERFNHLTVHRAMRPRVPRHLQRQQSLTAEIEKAVMKNLPEKLGRFTVSTIKEEEPEDVGTAGPATGPVTGPATAGTSPGTPATAGTGTPQTAPFILKLPEKRSPTSADVPPETVVQVESPSDQLTTKQRRDQFFSND